MFIGTEKLSGTLLISTTFAGVGMRAGWPAGLGVPICPEDIEA